MREGATVRVVNAELSGFVHLWRAARAYAASEGANQRVLFRAEPPEFIPGEERGCVRMGCARSACA